ncbi:hypothetical protein GCM10009582_02260 [Arthrobacter flavus]
MRLEGSVSNRTLEEVRENQMSAIHMYETALCCHAGVCGPDLDQSLVDVTADVRHLHVVRSGDEISR